MARTIKAKRMSEQQAITARPPTIPVVVASPYTPGTVDHVRRVLDPVLSLRRSGRITEAQYRAAMLYRDCYDGASEYPSGMAEQLGSRRSGSGTLSPRAFDACMRLREATRVLIAVPVPAGAIVNATVVVEMIVGQGWTIQGAAAAIHGTGADGRATGHARDLVASQLRTGLDALANLLILRATLRGKL